MIVAVGSWRGVGATSAALLLATCLAASDEQGAWLVEADPAGGSIAGRMQLPPHTIGGLERVAFPSDRGSVVEALHAVAHHHGTLRVVSAPADPFRAHACHHPRMPWAPALRDLPGAVVVDVGRIRAATPVWPLMHQADAVLLVSSPEVSAAVAASEWLHAAGRVSAADPGLTHDNARLLFVDAPGGVSFAGATLQAELREQCAGFLPWEPATVDLVHRGATAGDRRLRRSALMAAVNQLAATLSAPTDRP